MGIVIWPICKCMSHGDNMLTPSGKLCCSVTSEQGHVRKPACDLWKSLAVLLHMLFYVFAKRLLSDCVALS